MLAAATPVRRIEQCMGTVFSFDVRAPGVSHEAMQAALAWLHEADARFSTYRADSEISRIRRGELRLADAHPEVRSVLARCDEAQTATDGWFSARATGVLDPSGYVKGWAIDTLSRLLEAAGSTNHCVNGGGDVACVGRPATGRGWRVGIADPLHSGALLHTVEGEGPFGVATSGTAERGTHVVDPRTGRRPAELASVTVVAGSVLEADVLATAALACGAGAVRWLQRREAQAVVVHADGRVEAITGR
jgi:thiamine biosynthesis lipoprotein